MLNSTKRIKTFVQAAIFVLNKNKQCNLCCLFSVLIHRISNDFRCTNNKNIFFFFFTLCYLEKTSYLMFAEFSVAVGESKLFSILLTLVICALNNSLLSSFCWFSSADRLGASSFTLLSRQV